MLSPPDLLLGGHVCAQCQGCGLLEGTQVSLLPELQAGRVDFPLTSVTEKINMSSSTYIIQIYINM